MAIDRSQKTRASASDFCPTVAPKDDVTKGREGGKGTLGRGKAEMTYEGTRFFPLRSFAKEKGISSIQHCTKMFLIHSEKLKRK